MHLVPYVLKVDRDGTKWSSGGMVDARKNVKQLSNLCQHHSQGLHTGSSPVLTTMGKRYSESLIQDLNNE